jgi:hypothetical protein
MASPTEFSLERQLGPKRSVERVVIDGRNKRLISSKGHLSNRTTLIGDSIVQFVTERLYTSVQSLPGSYAKNFISMCEHGLFTVSNFQVIVVHMGCNDLCESNPYQICNIFENNIQYIRDKNPTCMIAISGILPKPCDSASSTKLEARVTTNEGLAALCKRVNVEYYKSEICIKDMGTIEELYIKDKIHLSDYAVDLLAKYLEGKIGSIYALKPQWDPETRSVIPKVPRQGRAKKSKQN